jgi:hypothetical protein
MVDGFELNSAKATFVCSGVRKSTFVKAMAFLQSCLWLIAYGLNLEMSCPYIYIYIYR